MKICKNCHREYDDNMAFCTKCGTKLESNAVPVTEPVAHQPVNQIPVNQPAQQQSMNQAPQTEKPVKKKKTALKTTAIIAAILVAVIVVRWVAVPFVQSMVRTTFNQNAPVAIENILDSGREKKEKLEMPVSGSEAVEIEENGLTVSIPENAMDPDQTVTVEQLNDDEYMSLAEQMIEPNFIALDAFHFDAGLGDDGRFYENTTLTFDLKEMDIPKKLWPYMVVYRQGDDGTVERIQSEVDGKQLICETNKNCIVVPGLAVIAVLSAVLVYTKLYPEYQERFLSNHPDYKNAQWYKTTSIFGFSVYWPENMMPPANPEAVKKASDEMQAIIIDILEQSGADTTAVKNHKTNVEFAKVVTETIIQKSKNESKGATQLRQCIRDNCSVFFENNEYKKLYEKVNSDKWQKENVWPTQVRVCMDAVGYMNKYLFSVRSFKKPTSATDIIILPKWPHGSGKGLAFNPQVGSGYMHINASLGLPKTIEEYNNKTKYQKAIDEMLLTITHEMIHISQTECYCKVEWIDYKALFEAVAVTLEREAYDYYSKTKKGDGSNEKIIQTESAKEVLTPSTCYESYTNTLGSSRSPYSFKDESTEAESYGYALADYLVFKRDNNYSKKNRDKFLERLMEAFSKQWTYDFNDAVKTASIETSCPEAYNREFTEFMLKSQEKVYGRFFEVKMGKLPPWNANFANQTHELSDKKPVVKIPVAESEYRSTIQELKVNYPSSLKKEDVNLVIHKDYEVDKSLENDELYLCVKPTDETKYTVAQEANTVYKKIAKGSTVINEIHSYSASADIDGNDVYEAILMTKPAQPTVKMEEKNLVIDLPQSPLAQAGKVKNYVVNIVVDNKKKPVVIETTERHIVIDTEEDPQLKALDNMLLDDESKAKFLAGLKPEEKLGAQMFFNGELGEIKDIVSWTKFFQGKATGQAQVEHEYKVTYAEQLNCDDVILGPVSDETVVQLMADDSAQFEGDFTGDWEGNIFFIPDETFAFDISEADADYAARGYNYKARITGGDTLYGELTENGKALQFYVVEGDPMTGEDLAELQEFFGKDSIITKWFAEGRTKAYKLHKFGKKRLISYIPPVIYHRED